MASAPITSTLSFADHQLAIYDWPTRLSILQGRMPVTKRLPYQWYDTPNIRVGTFKDFEVLAEKNGLQITDAFGLQDGQRVDTWPNLMAGTAVFKFERQ